MDFFDEYSFGGYYSMDRVTERILASNVEHVDVIEPVLATGLEAKTEACNLFHVGLEEWWLTSPCEDNHFSIISLQ